MSMRLRFARAFAVGAAMCTYALLSGCGGGSGSESQSTNHPPVAHDISMSVPANLTFGSTFSAIDPDGDQLTFQLQSQPVHGSVTLTPDRPLLFTYTPETNFFGTVSFTFVASDGKAVSNVATV